MHLLLGVITIPYPLADALKYVEAQENIEELCKTVRDMESNIMDLSSEEKWALGEALLATSLTQGLALPRIE